MHIQFKGIAAVTAVVLVLAGCDGKSAANAKSATPKTGPIVKEEADGLKRITLRDIETKRLGIEFEQVTKTGERLTIPYKALLYDPTGREWAFTSPEANVYIRAALKVETIVGDKVYLAQGPAIGTRLVTAGAAELYGIEFGIGR